MDPTGTAHESPPGASLQAPAPEEPAELIARQQRELAALRAELAALRSHEEGEIQEQRALRQRIVAHVPAGIAFLDRELTYRWTNPRYEAWFNDRVGTMIGRTLYELFPDMPRPWPRLQAVFERGETVVLHAFPYSFGEQETHWDITYVPTYNRAGEIDGVLLMTQDASERVREERQREARAEELIQLNQRLRELDRYKDEFVSVISHELRTPLNFITGFASLMADGVSGPLTEAQRRDLSKILSGADRMTQLVDDLLDFARLQAGNFLLNLAELAFERVAHEVVDTLRPLADQAGVTLHVAPLPPEAVRADEQRVLQVLTNLVSNAIKFTPAGGRIEVRAHREGDELLCEVCDTGIGIEGSDLPKLFQRFQQLDMSNTRKVGGTGLGLSITKALVEAHGGRIGVRSREGEGSTFWFSLPLSAPT